jgi:3'-5' exoribonuclease
MILSHHGQLEFASPKVPMFPEAVLLHYLDDLDSKMECMRALIENDRQVEGCFTTYSPALERVALKKSRYLNGEAPPAGAPAAAQPAPEAHPLFAPKSDSPFAGKLKQALGVKQES